MKESDPDLGFKYSHLKHTRPAMTLVERTSLYSNIQCPNCNRLFNKKAAQRHIGVCQDIVSKPKTLKEKKDE